jgi:hypothetical protein
MLSATTAELLKLQPVGRGFLILGRRVVAALAVSALEHNVVARHNPSSFPIANLTSHR